MLKLGTNLDARSIERFFGGLGQDLRAAREAKRDRDVFIAEDFSVFHYIEPDEPRISEIVADLLRPRGRHGQGTAFLAEFLRVLKFSACALEDAKIETEARTVHISSHRRRLDILVDLGTCGVGIESKVFGAEDQPGQLAEYASELDTRFGGNFKLLYLSYGPTGPSAESLPERERDRLDDAGKLTVVACAEFLHSWIQVCESLCNAEKVRWFLREFLAYIDAYMTRHEGGNVPVQNEDDGGLILSYALKNKDDLETALKVGARNQEIRKAVIGGFSEWLTGHLRSELNTAWQVENLGMFERQKGIRLFKSTWREHWIELAPDRSGGGNVFLCVRNRGNVASNERIKQHLDALRHGSSEGEWSWWFYLTPVYREWDSLDLLLKMYERDAGLLDYVRAEIVRVARAAEPVIDEIYLPHQLLAVPPSAGQ
jgi:hypothetical protein